MASTIILFVGLMITALLFTSTNASCSSSYNVNTDLDYNNQGSWQLKFDETYTPAAKVLNGSAEVVTVEPDEKLTVQLGTGTTFCANNVWFQSNCNKLKVACIAKATSDPNEPVVVVTEQAVYLESDQEVNVTFGELCKRITITVDHDTASCSLSELEFVANAK